jgi:predicted transcriptional regulator
MDYLKVLDEQNLIRDTESYAILNMDRTAIESAKERKARLKKEKEEINMLKKDVNDIKILLNQIMDKLNGS